MNGSRRVKRWWLRFDVIENLLDYVWVSDVGDDSHGADTQWAQANIKIKDSFEPLSPSQGSDYSDLPTSPLAYRVSLKTRRT